MPRLAGSHGHDGARERTGRADAAAPRRGEAQRLVNLRQVRVGRARNPTASGRKRRDAVDVVEDEAGICDRGADGIEGELKSRPYDLATDGGVPDA
jgi:hypothetical protein